MMNLSNLRSHAILRIHVKLQNITKIFLYIVIVSKTSSAMKTNLLLKYGQNLNILLRLSINIVTCLIHNLNCFYRGRG